MQSYKRYFVAKETELVLIFYRIAFGPVMQTNVFKQPVISLVPGKMFQNVKIVCQNHCIAVFFPFLPINFGSTHLNLLHFCSLPLIV